MYVWKIKETQAPESDLPSGAGQERGEFLEAVTATALLVSGAEL